MIFFLTSTLMLLVLVYVYRRRKLNFFIKAGISGPTPHFLFGNILELRKETFNEVLSKWSQKYGKIFGYFEGPIPNLVIGDPEIIQEIFVKQCNIFHGRKPFPFEENPDKAERVSVFHARGNRWKRLRPAINLAFSKLKMRQMIPIIDESISVFTSQIDQLVSEKQSDTNMQTYIQRMVMDIICKCAFGVETKCQTNMKHPFIIFVEEFLSNSQFTNFKSIAFYTFSEFSSFILTILKLLKRTRDQNTYLKEIRSKLIPIIEARKDITDKSDLFQLLLDAKEPSIKNLDEKCPLNKMSSRLNSSIENNNEKDVESKDESKNSSSKLKVNKLTKDEIINQGVLFLLASYDSTSTALSYAIYLLAMNPDIQKRLQQEIDKVYMTSDSTNISSQNIYDWSVKLPYLKAVIYEVLRMHPFASTITNRMCLKSGGTYLSNGLYIPEGLNIIPNVYEIHNDKDIWTTVNPKIFAPERFLKTTGDKFTFIGPPHPFAWMPFGGGPRQCVGQRFSMIIMKATLMKLVYNFQMEPSKSTEKPLTLKVGVIISPKNGIYVDIFKRIH